VKPTHCLYNVTGDGDNASWTQIGAAWQHGDKNGFNIVCNAMPIGGRMVMRLITDKSTEAE